MLSDELCTAPADVLVLPMTEDLKKAAELATAFRETGIRTMLYTEKKKFKAKMSYADKISVPFVVFLGEDEIAKNEVSVKNMKTGEQQALSRDNAIALIQKEIEKQKAVRVIKEN